MLIRGLPAASFAHPVPQCMVLPAHASKDPAGQGASAFADPRGEEAPRDDELVAPEEGVGRRGAPSLLAGRRGGGARTRASSAPRGRAQVPERPVDDREPSSPPGGAEA